MKVRLIDVANKAGVSKSTASQYINGRYEYMSAETKERIKKAIDELGFIPNQIARSLKTKKTNTVGVILNNITGSVTTQVIRGIYDYCKKKEYNVLIYITDYNADLEKDAIATLKSLRADGLIITSSGEINEFLNQENQSDLPVVHIYRTFNGLNVNTVLSDHFKGAYEATEYLISLGHQRIALITRPYKNIPSRYNRIQGCLDALKAHGISCDTSLIPIYNNKNNIEKIYDNLMSLPEPPTAILTMYSIITVDLLNHLNNKGISIPEDISIIGFDNLPLAHLLKTPLTSVNQPAYELGEQSAKLLLQKIANPQKEQDNITLPCELIIRDSCRKIY